MEYGLLVETLETATTWSNLLPLYRAVRAALPGMALCHVSHVYADGASLYFTVIADAPRGEEEARWQALKRSATEAITEHGGTLSHHHGVGTDHRTWLEREKGAVGLQTLHALKRTMDPEGILNPGKLLP
jgi:alkyldihydroxyacetonephosphate synthase